MSRPDGRANDQLRRIEIELGGLARVDGSARFSFAGNCRALASVTGPIEVRQLIELPDRATFEVTVRPVAGVPATPEKALAKHVHDVFRPTLLLTQHPRSLIQLTILSLSPASSSPSYAATHINAATLALLNAASVPMKGVVCAVAVGISKTGDVVLDPADDGECIRAGCFALFFSGAEAPEGDIVWADWRGATSKEEASVLYESAVRLAQTGAKQVLVSIQSSLLRRGKSDSQMDLS
ncbi:3' exoribonuclease family domain-containing protein [Rhizoctonia solani AG-1 IA]|uniref:3' exoribonuclease family domain-containing protein n=1 Tax=Thanatephorus cucumeris (strain AG1-IA) TaxID=983506 RepID=L8X443_THACA|nr:3' exoribonuclease family domain-containing protein [Rhizoctonia solani AG-1 IA]